MDYSFIPQDVLIRTENTDGYTFVDSDGTSRTLYPAIDLPSLQRICEVLGPKYSCMKMSFAGFSIKIRWQASSQLYTIADDDPLELPVLLNSDFPDLAQVIGSGNFVRDFILENFEFSTFKISTKSQLDVQEMATSNADVPSVSLYSINENLQILYATCTDFGTGPIIFMDKVIIVRGHSNSTAHNNNLSYILSDGTLCDDAYNVNNMVTTATRRCLSPLYFESTPETEAIPNVYVLIRGQRDPLKTITKDGKTYLICGPFASRYVVNLLFPIIVISEDAIKK